MPSKGISENARLNGVVVERAGKVALQAYTIDLGEVPIVRRASFCEFFERQTV